MCIPNVAASPANEVTSGLNVVSGTHDQGISVAKQAIFVMNIVTFTTFEVMRARDNTT